jgi:N-acyl-D-aspartate/D-glutamate deacylase
MHDLVVRGGTIVDGTGGRPFTGDLAVDGSRVTAVGRVEERGRRELDAGGLLVLPGFVDVHTHYDGQVTWDPYLTPSSQLGVTTVVMGNCGVGFAPVAPDRHDWLIGLMEGVEDIPGTALAERLGWGWESFGEYLDVVEGTKHAIDVAAQVPHGALRAYVMGERGADHEQAPSAEEAARMAALVSEALEAGALGFSSSRTRNHRTRDGALTPSLSAGADELLAIAGGLGRAGAGVLEFVSDFRDVEAEFALLRSLCQHSGRPLSVSLTQVDTWPEQWRRLLELIEQANAEGLRITGQVAARPIGLLLGLEGTLHPFVMRPSYRALAGLALAERVAAMRRPEVRRAILEERPEGRGMFGFAGASYDRLFCLGDPPDYEPPPEASVAAQAARLGRDPQELAYDLLLEDEGRALLYYPALNYSDGHLEAAREMLLHPCTVPGLGDAGAHCGVICDGSFPAFMVSFWARDRTRGERLPLEWVVKAQARDTAELVGLGDRGLLAPGKKADLNLVDFEGLRLRPPRIAHDLPAGGRRLVQEAEGFVATVVSGQVVYEDGEPTGALPGRLVRGARG